MATYQTEGLSREIKIDLEHGGKQFFTGFGVIADALYRLLPYNIVGTARMEGCWFPPQTDPARHQGDRLRHESPQL
eukprot:4027668-Amphidinium_carterae.1